MNLFDFKRSEIIRTENFHSTAFWALWGILSGVFTAFWAVAMILVKPQELLQWLILGTLCCIVGSLCLAWIFANIFPNMLNDSIKKKKAKRKLIEDANIFLGFLYKYLEGSNISSCDIQDIGILMMNPCLDEVKDTALLLQKRKVIDINKRKIDMGHGFYNERWDISLTKAQSKETPGVKITFSPKDF
jgi:hypothetical protein